MTEYPAFDHLIHWVHNLDEARDDYQACGLPTHEALAMPGFRNAAWGVDDERYVELAVVDDWNAVETSKYARSLEVLKPAIDVLDGQGLLSFAVAVPDAHVVATRLRRTGHEVEVVEVWFEEKNAGFVEVFATDMPAHFPFFITYDPPRAEIGRMRAAHREAAGISLDGQPELVALLIGSADPEKDARQLADFIGVPARGPIVELHGAEVHLERCSQSGLFGFTVRGFSHKGETTIAGAVVAPEA